MVGVQLFSGVRSIARVVVGEGWAGMVRVQVEEVGRLGADEVVGGGRAAAVNLFFIYIMSIVVKPEKRTGSPTQLSLRTVDISIRP